MYDLFTDRARKVMQLANLEAQRFHHESIRPEHILLGIVRGDEGMAVEVIKRFDIDPREVRIEIEKLMQSGPGIISIGKLPQTYQAKKVIESAMEEARSLNHNYVGTEHILLGLLDSQEDTTGLVVVAAQVLMQFGLHFWKVRKEIQDILESKGKESKKVPTLVVGVNPQVCSLEGDGVMSLRFPDGKTEDFSFAFADSVQAEKADGMVRRWLAAHIKVVLDYDGTCLGFLRK